MDKVLLSMEDFFRGGWKMDGRFKKEKQKSHYNKLPAMA